MSGTKVTTDPSSLSPKNENPGVVTSDSLAAESINDGGDFAANSASRGPMGQPSSSTNTNTTDTSGATTLNPAPDAEARQATEDWSESAQLGDKQGVGPTYNTSGGAGGQQDDIPVSQPAGKGLTEGGFDAGAPNASFGTDIGGKNDPGRQALNDFQTSDVPSAGGAGPRQSQVTNDGQFDVLGETSS